MAGDAAAALVDCNFLVGVDDGGASRLDALALRLRPLGGAAPTRILREALNKTLLLQDPTSVKGGAG